jgi:uncharacterized membrane protein YdjX (TVP38/TMEM64 family)
MRRLAILVAAAAAGLALLWVLGRAAGAALPDFAAWVTSLGPLGPIAYVAAYAAATVALVPGSILTLAAGALFGIARGTVYALLGATLGAIGAFLVSRHAARRQVERRLADDPRFDRLDRAVGREGLKVVFLLRLSPLFPFTLLNYALGLTRVRLGQYVIASIGMLPGTLLYVYYGKVAGDVAAIAAGVPVARGPWHWLLLGLGLVATLVLSVYIARLATRALQREEVDGHVVAGP